MPLCEVCKEKPALIFFSAYEGGKKTDHQYCVGCAFDRKIQKAAHYVERVGEAIVNDPVFKAAVPDPDTDYKAPAAEKQPEPDLQPDPQPEADLQSAPQPENERCSFCGKANAVCKSKSGTFRLCEVCAFLLYPHMDLQAAVQEGLPIEEAVGDRTPPNPCAVCRKREAQFFLTDGNYCMICAKRKNLPEADKKLRRMEIPEESFAAFAEAAAAEDQQETASAAPAADAQAHRFAVTDRDTVNGQEILVIRDNFTGMHYLTNGQLSAFTPLLDGSGKPFIMIG